jgi:hypothetical protein
MLRYYPSFRVKSDLITTGFEYRIGNIPYKGKYYLTYDGRAFSGPNPIVGPNEELIKLNETYIQDLSSNLSLEAGNVGISLNGLPKEITDDILKRINNTIRGVPTPYFPFASDGDYKKGYLLRSFTKRVNDRGFVIEISNEEYANFINGTVDYDVSDYLVLQILWKLTGPLNSVRVNQYDTRVGIIETNKRLVENANKTFLGITDFIGGDYTKFAKPTL